MCRAVFQTVDMHNTSKRPPVCLVSLGQRPRLSDEVLPPSRASSSSYVRTLQGGYFLVDDQLSEPAAPRPSLEDRRVHPPGRRYCDSKETAQPAALTALGPAVYVLYLGGERTECPDGVFL